VTFMGFHEILPGLGAFGVVPDENGLAKGLEPLEQFLDAVLSHLSNRTTAQERVSYHVSEVYNRKESAVSYGVLKLSETDIYGPDYRALPPAEHMVLVASYRHETQRQFAAAVDGFVYVCLGRGSNGPHVHPNLARVRHVVLRSGGAVVAPGLLLLRERGFRIYSRSQLRLELGERAGLKGIAAWQASAAQDDEEQIYALFRTKPDTAYRGLSWDGNMLTTLIEAFESDPRNKLVVKQSDTSLYPRIISLRDLLRARTSI
jgi:hypothetical protein